MKFPVYQNRAGTRCEKNDKSAGDLCFLSTDTPATQGRTYYRVVVEGPSTPYPQVPVSQTLSGNMVGLSNPIYFNFDPDF